MHFLKVQVNKTDVLDYISRKVKRGCDCHRQGFHFNISLIKQN